jgi:2-keto-4-pentenoate hydratase/2-oxohepta-3-ene-1,7-dioic acid hydratase in catechol pathway
MRLCRIGPEDAPSVAFYDEKRIVPIDAAADAFEKATGTTSTLQQAIKEAFTRLDTRKKGGHFDVSGIATGRPLRALKLVDDLLAYLPGGDYFSNTDQLARWLPNQPSIPGQLDASEAELLVPIPKPNKILLLAGNYAEHIKERGGVAAERAETFPYVFMKPPSTTLNHPSKPVVIPKISPGAIDWELELAVVIGKKCKAVTEADALKYVAGYTIINDISNRQFRPNPGRKKREKDTFFDWLHGKWFDSFCPCGPCIASADEIPDPQSLPMKLTLNGETRQDGNTSQMIFPVAALIEFISAMVTLEPGDLISTGTPSGVGNATGTYLKAGDVMCGTISGIGTLVTRMSA